jgi:hypothetical protein
VVQHDDHLEAVRQRSHRVGRKLHIPRGQRTGRSLRGPFGRPVLPGGRGRGHEQTPQNRSGQSTCHRAPPAAPLADGRMVITSRLSGVK